MSKYVDRCYSPEDLKKTQEILTLVLKELLRVCEKNNIDVVLDSGSAIGAVRHKGFIPWDDDIDVAVSRKDYDRLMKILPKELGEKFGSDNWLDNKDFPAPDACVYAKTTVAIPIEMKNCKYRYGISLGIYPYDNIWDDEKKAKKQMKKCWFWHRIHWLKVLPFPYVPFTGIKRTVVHTICGIAHVCLFLIPKKTIVSLCEKYSRECNHIETKRAAIFSFPDIASSIVDKSKVYPLADAEFEKIPVKLVNCYDELLNNEYSNSYMELPPVESRKNHFPCEMSFGDFQ